MTQPDPQPQSPSPAIPAHFEREIEAIDIDELDKENLGWTKNYVAGLRERLTTEQAAASPDFVMISYLKKEIATYQELLDRTTGG